MRGAGFLLKRNALAAAGLVLVNVARGQEATNQFSFNEFLLAPVRVHLLSAKASPAIHTTLTSDDITRILGKINNVWAQAGLNFYLESLVREEAQEISSEPGKPIDRRGLLELRPPQSRATHLFHVYYIKQMPVNGIYFPEGIFVKDTASLRDVEGGIDEPIPRVTSHELGHAFGLPHRQDTTNLMASGTTGTCLNAEEIGQAREAARSLDWVEPASDLMEKANALFTANRSKEAAALYARVATIQLRADQVEMAKQRATLATRTNATSK